MKTVLSMLMMLMVLLLAVSVSAKELCFGWTLNTDNVTSKYTVYQDSRSNVLIPDIPLKSTFSGVQAGRHKVCVELKDNDPHNFFVTASNADGGESKNSNVIAYYPVQPDPDPIKPIPQSPNSVILVIPADEAIKVNVEVDPSKE